MEGDKDEELQLHEENGVNGLSSNTPNQDK